MINTLVKNHKARVTKLVSLIILSILITKTTQEMLPENVLLAINCGGEAFKDSKDIQYLEDSFVDGGQSSDFGSQFEIKNTYDQTPYQTERWSENDFTYTLPISEGKHTIVLKFSEVYFNSASEKIFDVNIGNKKIISQIDIFSKVGKSTAYDEFIEVEIKNKKAYYRGKAIENGYDAEKESLILIFKKGERDNPKINGILVVKGGIENTDYEAFKDQLEDMERVKMEKERTQREIKKRNNLHYDFEEFEDDFVDTDEDKKSSYFGRAVSFSIICSIIYVLYKLFFKGSSSDVGEDLKED